MNDLTDHKPDILRAILTDTFEGVTLTRVEVRGRPAYIAREIGEAIGYAHGGKRFATRIRETWAAEMQDGRDYAVLNGEALATFKRLVGTNSVPSKTNQGLLILFERGLHLALLKTTKPAGERLRAYLAESIMPGLARGQAVRDGDAQPEPRRAIVDELRAEADLIRAKADMVRAHAERIRAETERLRVEAKVERGKRPRSSSPSSSRGGPDFSHLQTPPKGMTRLPNGRIIPAAKAATVRQVWTLICEGLPDRDIVKMLGVKRQLVHRIRRGLRYRWVQEEGA